MGRGDGVLRQVVPGIHGTQPLGAHEHGRLQGFGQLQQLGLGAEDAAAHKYRRVLRIAEQGGRLLDQVGVRLHLRVVAGPHGNFNLGLLAHHIRRHLEEYRPVASGIHLPERFGDKRRRFLRAIGTGLPLGHRRHRPLLIHHFVEKANALVDGAARNLPAHAKHLGAETVSREQGGAGVQHARSGNDGADPFPSGRLGIAERHIGRALLVPGMDNPQPVLLTMKAVEQRVELGAGQPEYGIDTVAND